MELKMEMLRPKQACMQSSAVVPNLLCNPRALSDVLKHPFSDTTCHVPNMLIWIGFKQDVNKINQMKVTV